MYWYVLQARGLVIEKITNTLFAGIYSDGRVTTDMTERALKYGKKRKSCDIDKIY